MSNKQHEVYSPQPNRHSASLIARLALAGSISVGGIVAYENYENFHIFAGITNNDNEITIPKITDCEDMLQPVSNALTTTTTTTTEKPTPSNVPNEEPVTTSTIPETTTTPVPTTISDYEKRILKHNSAVQKFDYRDPKSYIDLAHVPVQYQRYFDNQYMTHTSERSGIVYPIFIFGETSNPPHIDTESINKLEYAPFEKTIQYLEPKGLQHAVDCMRTFIFEDDKLAGRKIPIIIPSQPASIENGRIKFHNNDGVSGYTMPFAEFSFLFFDVNPKYKEFIILTTGPNFDTENPYVEPWLMSHEFAHKWIELVQENYRLKAGPEERTAHELHNKARQNWGFACIEPPVVYGDPEVIRQEIKRLQECW